LRGFPWSPCLLGAMKCRSLFHRVEYVLLDAVYRFLEGASNAIHAAHRYLDRTLGRAYRSVIRAMLDRLAALEAETIIERIINEPRGSIEPVYAGIDVVADRLYGLGFRAVYEDEFGIGLELRMVSQELCREVDLVWKVAIAVNPWFKVLWRPCGLPAAQPHQDL
jgi:hypothetical protein